MTDDKFGLSDERLRSLLGTLETGEARSLPVFKEGPKGRDILSRLPGIEELYAIRRRAESLGISSPYGRLVEPLAGVGVRIEGREVVTFASYDYLGIGRDARLARVAADAVERWGSSAFASRTVSGERVIHRELEAALARFHGVEAALVFVSGHATNVTVVGRILAGGGVLVHDERIHNSIRQGAALAHARCLSFSHNDPEAAGKTLAAQSGVRGIVVLAIEGLYSMDGDVPDLSRFVDLARRHGALLMVDEAHSVGVLGSSGGGIGEAQGASGDEVDLWMGTLSKALAGCGGYIAGSSRLIDYLRHTAPGFVFSVGIAPVMAAISLEALRILGDEPERVGRLQSLGRFALQTARRLSLDTGRAGGHAVLPVIVGRSAATVGLASSLLENGFDVPAAIPPAVEDRAARLRLFLTAAHTEAQVEEVLTAISISSAGV